MKKITGFIFIAFLYSNIVVAAESHSVFIGYTASDKERYITWGDLDYTLAQLAHTGQVKQISKHAATCMNDKNWTRAEMIKSKTRPKDSYYSYKFKFHWLLDSKILNVNIDGRSMSCSEG